MYTLYIFRRDLRIQDNKALYHLINYNTKDIIPCFIFTPEQISEKNKYRSLHAIQFMVESLQTLDTELQKYNSRLHYFQGTNIDVLENIRNKIPIDRVAFAQDYTPYAQKRDRQIFNWCKKHNIECTTMEDYLLADIGDFLKDNQTPYQIFTPFKNNVLKQEDKISRPKKISSTLIKMFQKTKALKSLECGLLYQDINHPKQMVRGGRKNALSLMKKSITQNQSYDECRNMLTYASSYLSAYIKFGCISIREVYWSWRDRYGKTHGLLSQLLWREFYYYIIVYYPQGLKGESFQQKYKNLRWENNVKHWNAWKSGTTGYPIVDASMRQMIATGYMSNRSRLISANFLVRILGIAWQKGEQYFATMLTDYDPAVNNGNWQWVSSVGVDPKPHFQRLFNTWTQSKDYDPKSTFIKTWLPDLASVPARHIHAWDIHCSTYNLKTYPNPIVTYKNKRNESLEKYNDV